MNNMQVVNNKFKILQNYFNKENFIEKSQNKLFEIIQAIAVKKFRLKKFHTIKKNDFLYIRS